MLVLRPTVGAGTEVFAAKHAGVEVCDVAQDETATYLVNGGVTVPSGRNGTVYRVDRATGAPTLLLKKRGPLRKVAQDSRALYMFHRRSTPKDELVLLEVDKVTGVDTMLSRLESSLLPYSLASAGDQVLAGVCDANSVLPVTSLDQSLAAAKIACSIRAISRHGGASRTLVKGIGAPEDLRVDGTDVYFVDGANGNVGRAPLAGGAVTWLAKGQGAAWSLDTDDTWVFFTVNDAGELRAIKKDGSGSVRTLATGIEGIHGVRVQGGSLLVRTNVAEATYEAVIFGTPMATGGADRMLRADKAALLGR